MPASGKLKNTSAPSKSNTQTDNPAKKKQAVKRKNKEFFTSHITG
jgi:hypothetical protein